MCECVSIIYSHIHTFPYPSFTMKYTEVTFSLSPVDPIRDLFVDALGNEGPYDSFVETPDGLKAYIPTDQFNPAWLQDQISVLQ